MEALLHYQSWFAQNTSSALEIVVQKDQFDKLHIVLAGVRQLLLFTRCNSACGNNNKIIFADYKMLIRLFTLENVCIRIQCSSFVLRSLLLRPLILDLRRHCNIQIRKVWEWKAASENCFVMINSPPDSRRRLHCCAKLQVATSYYPCLANGRRRQIIHLPWWRRGTWGLCRGGWTACQSGEKKRNKDSKWQLKVKLIPD